MIKKITAPLTTTAVEDLKAGDIVHLSGTIIVARDAAHQRMVAEMKSGGTLPFSLKNEVIFYAGPAPTPPGAVIGPIGPTTSYRMDPYTPYMLDKGVRGMIGKGKRSTEVLEAIKKYKAVYFGATGGTSVLLSNSVTASEELIYPDLGPETVLRLTIKNMPLVVLADMYGGNLYERH